MPEQKKKNNLNTMVIVSTYSLISVLLCLASDVSLTTSRNNSSNVILNILIYLATLRIIFNGKPMLFKTPGEAKNFLADAITVNAD